MTDLKKIVQAAVGGDDIKAGDKYICPACGLLIPARAFNGLLMFALTEQDLPEKKGEPCRECRGAADTTSRQDEIHTRLKAWIDKSVPDDYKAATVAMLPGHVRQDVVDFCQDSHTWGLLIIGPVKGVGKTFTGFAALRRYYGICLRDAKNTDLSKQFVRFETMPALIRQYRLSFQGSGNGKIVEQLKKFTGMLLIDDFGAESITATDEEIAFEIINARQMWKRKTILTSNKGLDEIEQLYSEGRIASRLASGKIIKLTGNDKRMVKK